ncbi:uncharacterized protein LOC118647621 [Monomorium pharaonis]|uniref:uncharacterized protein LOC118647621 n=1 Tax=Monomorium pharaonis TaxID=307658 RepID=UPI00174728E9|nr:uncharacterized protein LOC118647621 [Monomorium pharaonis]
MHKIQLISNYRNYKKQNKMHKIKYVKDIIQDLENYGPASLIHIAILSNIIKRPINIWNANGSLNKTIGKQKLGQSVDIEYHANSSEQIGHWTLRDSKDPDNVIIDLNSCLFSVIGSQIGQNPLKLRKWTVLKLKNNFQNLAKWLDKIQWKKGAEIFFMIGGVNGHGPESPRKSPGKKSPRKSPGKENPKKSPEEEGYSKRYPKHNTPEHAKNILNNSEGKLSEGGDEKKYWTIGQSRTRHLVGGRNGGVETWTRNNPHIGKFAFLTEEDQNYVTHRALLSKSGQEALHKLNDAIEYKVEIPVSELVEPDISFPQASRWYKGIELHGLEDIKFVNMLLRHQKDKRDKIDEEPFIVYIYPITGTRFRYPSNNQVEDAKRILDKSEGKFSAPDKEIEGKKEEDEDEDEDEDKDKYQGHSRQRHVVKRRNNAEGVEAYTKNYPCESKSAFQTEEDQEYVTHRALLSEQGRRALYELYERDVILLRVPVTEMEEPGVPFPKGTHWHNGIQIDNNKKEIESVDIYLRHQKDKRENKNEEPFIHTCYPNFKDIKQIKCRFYTHLKLAKQKVEKGEYSQRYPSHNTKQHAKDILNDSENKPSERLKTEIEYLTTGHSRTWHVVEGRNGGVITWTRNNPGVGKYAFQTEDEQDYVTHRALLSKTGQKALYLLAAATKIEETIPVSELVEPDVEFPTASRWYNGIKLHGDEEIKFVSIHLRHRKGQRRIRNAKPFIAHIYPITGTRLRYPSNSEINDAKQILDNSEGEFSAPDKEIEGKEGEDKEENRGHSRQRHVVERKNNAEGVKAYTRNNPCESRFAFLTETDQDYVTHRALLSEQGRRALYELYEQDVILLRVPVTEIKEPGVSFPKGTHWYNGIQIEGVKEIVFVEIHLRHQKNKREEKDAKPFILNSYPILKNIQLLKCPVEKHRELEEKKEAKITRKSALATTSKTASATTSETASKTPKIALKSATGTIHKTGRVTTPEIVSKINPTTASATTSKAAFKTPPKIALKSATRTIPKTTKIAPTTASATTSKTPSKTPPKIALKSAAGTIRKTIKTASKTASATTSKTSSKTPPKSVLKSAAKTTFKTTSKSAS